jgi:hypothetical protein
MKAKPMSSRDALSCPQASRLVPSSHPLIGQQPAFSIAPANSCTPSISLTPSAGKASHTTYSQLLPAGFASPSDNNIYTRDRANSFKRKAQDNLALAAAKAIKLSDSLPSLVSQLSDHKLLVEKIGVEVSDEDFTDATDPAIVSILQKFSLALSAQHSIVSNVVSELEG